nr:SusE domain-containing protein [Prolixibacteraceae bacterium]
GDGPELVSPSSGSSIVLEREGAEENTVSFSWSEADFGFPSATSYTVQFDLAGNDFSDPFSLVTTSDTFAVATQADLNNDLMEFGLPVAEETAVIVRVTASVSDDITTLTSATADMNITLYASSFPSIYMIGAGTGGWDPGLAAEVASTGVPYNYETTAYFDSSGDGNFRFFNNPDWGASLGGYDVFTTYPTDLLEVAEGDDDPNFRFIGESGWYIIHADTENSEITMEATEEPVLYAVGDATTGWDFDPGTATLSWTGHQIYEGDIDFTQDLAFRFFAQADWGSVSYGYDTLTKYDTSFIDIMEGNDDPNWQFVAESGNYHVVVNIREKTVEITKN